MEFLLSAQTCHNNNSGEFTANSQQIHSLGEPRQEHLSPKSCRLGKGWTWSRETGEEGGAARRGWEGPATAPSSPCQGREVRSEVGKGGLVKSWVEGGFCAACLSFSIAEYILIVNKLN